MPKDFFDKNGFNDISVFILDVAFASFSYVAKMHNLSQMNLTLEQKMNKYIA